MTAASNTGATGTFMSNSRDATKKVRVIDNVVEMKRWRVAQAGFSAGKTVGFVPTMGALHEGHASLIKRSLAENHHTAVSIFVNPSQFAPGEDLDQYPRTLHDDVDMLTQLGVDVLFLPSAKEMYPRGIPLDVSQQQGPFVSVLGVSEMLEGKTRPNFFRGVATVVTKLLNIVMPENAYFGQKDVQQYIVLETMVRELFMYPKLTMCPIMRDANGLALSSRNKYLCAESVGVVPAIYQGLTLARDYIESHLAQDLARDQIVQVVKDKWSPYVSTGEFKIDYISLADWETLQEVVTVPSDETNSRPKMILSCAVYVTDRKHESVTVRLIDNIVIG